MSYGFRRSGAALACAIAIGATVPVDAGPLFPPASQVAKLVPHLQLFEDSVHFGSSAAIAGDLMVVGAPEEDLLDDNSGAAYVFVRAAGDWYLQAKLVPSDGGFFDKFGFSVAIDGLTVVVGAPGHPGPGGTNQGAAYVFVRSSDGQWGEWDKLMASDGSGADNFGDAVAIDGDTVVVGARGHDASGSNAGTAYVFVNSGGTWSQQQKLSSSDLQGGDHFGSSVAIDGDTAVVGAEDDDHGAGDDEGSAYVFVRAGTVWTQQQRLYAADAAANDQFGNAVAISNDTIVAGSLRDDHAGGTDAGSAYVFVRSGTVWGQQHKLVASTADADDAFGWSVDVDLDTAVVGALFGDLVSPDGGSAYVFTRSGSVWSEQQEIGGDYVTNDLFGSAVGVSGDTIVGGAVYDDNFGGADAGSATVFERVGGVWAWDQLLVAQRSFGANSGLTVDLTGETAVVGQAKSLLTWPQDVGVAWVFQRLGPFWVQQYALINWGGDFDDGFGRSVAIDGDTVVVGAREGVSNLTGWAKIYRRSGDVWSEQAFLEGDSTGVDLFGDAVAIDGDAAVVGAPGDGPQPNAGAAFVFVRSGTVWSEQAKLVAGDPAQGDSLGDSVAADGDTAVIGAPLDDHAIGNGAGSAYVFTRSGTSWSQQQKLISSDIQAGDAFGGSVAIDGDTAVIGARLDDHSGLGDAGSAYVFTRSGTTWTEEQKLVASDAAPDARFGCSVSIDGDTIAIGASEIGAVGAERVYIFSRSAGVWTAQERLTSTQPGDEFGYSVAIDGSTVLAGAPTHNVPASFGSGATFVFDYEAAPPSLPFDDGFESGDTSGWSSTVP